jgi:hypothetical protein
VTKKPAAPAQKGWSFTRILLLTAVVGIVAGTAIGFLSQPEISTEQLVEEEMKRLMPRGDAIDPRDPMEPDPASLRGIPPYPGVYPRRMMKKAGAQEVPMSVSWFSTQDPASTVLDFYEKAFAADGRRPVAHRTSDTMGYVAWFEEQPDAGNAAAGVLHMVSAMKQFSQTIVLISASRPDLAMSARPRLPDGLELPPNSSAPQSVQMGEEQLANEVIYSRTLNTSPSEVVTFFQRQFQDRGFTLTDSSSSPTQASVTGQKGPTTVVVAVRAEGSHSSVVLTYERRATPQEVGP